MNQEDLLRVRAKVSQEDWAARLLERVEAYAEDFLRGNHSHIYEAALVHALTDEPEIAARVGERLSHQAQWRLADQDKHDPDVEPEWSNRGAEAWAYDLVFNALSAEQRNLIEDYFRALGRRLIHNERLWTTTPNLVFDKHDVRLRYTFHEVTSHGSRSGVPSRKLITKLPLKTSKSMD